MARPPLPLEVRHAAVTVTLDVSLSDPVFPGDDDNPEGITLGHLVAAKIADRITPRMDELTDRAEEIFITRLQAAAGKIIADVLARQGKDPWDWAAPAELTVVGMIERSVHDQLNTPSQTASARGRSPVPVIEAIIATEVTTALRRLAADEVGKIRAKILADIASSAGRG